MKFHKYSSITNSYSSKFINKLAMEGFTSKDIRYEVTEKIHGANFSVYVNEIETAVASRTQVLGEGASFYNVASIEQDLRAKGQDMFIHMKSLGVVHDTDTLIIHGELCGGTYPNYKSSQKQVQKGVFYSPKLEFLVFDIAILDKDEEYTLLNQNDVWDYSVKAGYDVLPLLHEGTLEECMTYSNDFDSKIHEMFDLPKLDKPNICEGVVIKPEKPLYLADGTRVILKNKNEIFSEKTKEPKIVIPLSDKQSQLIYDTIAYVTEQRLDNILSKEIDFDFEDKKNIGVLMKTMMTDTFDEINNETDLFKGLQPTDKKLVQKHISNAVKSLVLPRF